MLIFTSEDRSKMVANAIDRLNQVSVYGTGATDPRMKAMQDIVRIEDRCKAIDSTLQYQADQTTALIKERQGLDAELAEAKRTLSDIIK